MYFPILRGRQFELIALRELLKEEIMSERVIPIIEPVKLSSTLVKTNKMFIEKNRALALVQNPQVGSFINDMKEEKNVVLKETFENSIASNGMLLYVRILNSKSSDKIDKFIERHYENMMTICVDKDAISVYEEKFETLPVKYNLIPDETGFRRKIRTHRVILNDKFNKLDRNTDYADKDEPFSEDHLYYKDDGYEGFSDYSVVGNDYSESGFAPYAVAIHIVYFSDDDSIRIRHFVSDSNDDITDPAGKFKEAVEKLVEWNKTQKLNTKGIREFENLYKREAYPGLGTVKKLSIMHHIELMSQYLDRE